jgi:hypothetical protein
VYGPLPYSAGTRIPCHTAGDNKHHGKKLVGNMRPEDASGALGFGYVTPRALSQISGIESAVLRDR